MTVVTYVLQQPLGLVTTSVVKEGCVLLYLELVSKYFDNFYRVVYVFVFNLYIFYTNMILYQAWWLIMPVIDILRRLRKED